MADTALDATVDQPDASADIYTAPSFKPLLPPSAPYVAPSFKPLPQSSKPTVYTAPSFKPLPQQGIGDLLQRQELSPGSTFTLNQRPVTGAAPLDTSAPVPAAPKGAPENPDFLKYLDASNKRFAAQQAGDTETANQYDRQMQLLAPLAFDPSTISPLPKEQFEAGYKAAQPPSTLGQMVAKPLAGYGQFAAAATGELANIPAALAGYTKPGEELGARQDLGEQMPVERRLRESGKAGIPGEVALGLAKSAPKMAAIALAPETAAAVGIPAGLTAMASGGALFGLDDQGNFSPKDAAFGALFPAVGQLGRRAASEAILKAAQSGAPIPNELGQKIVKSVGSQIAQGAWQMAQDSDRLTKEYYSDRGQFNKSMADIIGSNLGYALFGTLSERPEFYALDDFAQKQAKALVKYVPPPPTPGPFTAPVAPPMAPVSQMAKGTDLDKLQADLEAKEKAAAAEKPANPPPVAPPPEPENQNRSGVDASREFKALQDQLSSLDMTAPNFDSEFERITGRMEEIKNQNQGYVPGTEPKGENEQIQTVGKQTGEEAGDNQPGSIGSGHRTEETGSQGVQREGAGGADQGVPALGTGGVTGEVTRLEPDDLLPDSFQEKRIQSLEMKVHDLLYAHGIENTGFFMEDEIWSKGSQTPDEYERDLTTLIARLQNPAEEALPYEKTIPQITGGEQGKVTVESLADDFHNHGFGDALDMIPGFGHGEMPTRQFADEQLGRRTTESEWNQLETAFSQGENEAQKYETQPTPQPNPYSAPVPAADTEAAEAQNQAGAVHQPNAELTGTERPNVGFQPDQSSTEPTKPVQETAAESVPADAVAALPAPAAGAVIPSPDSDYWMNHRPNSEGPQGHDLLSTDLAPRDIYEHPDYYTGDPGSLGFKQSLASLRAIRGKPDATVTVYRASPKNALNWGDWISLSRVYSKQHGMADNPSDDVPVHAFKVKAKDIRWDGNTLEEFGYFPKAPKSIGPSSSGLSPVAAPASTPAKAEARPNSGFKKRIGGVNAPFDAIDKFRGQVSSTGKINLAAVRKIDPHFKPVGAARALFAKDGTVMPDLAAMQMGFTETHGEEHLLTELNKAARNRIAERFQEAPQAEHDLEIQNKALAFEKAARQRKGETILPHDMNVGDTFKLKGETLKVTELHFDDNGDVEAVTVQDGRKFGVQTVRVGSVINIDPGTLKATPPSTEFHPEEKPTRPSLLDYAKSKVPPSVSAALTNESQAESFRAQWERDYPPEQTPAAPVPKLASGEKGTGDLFKGEDQPFNLAGEKASDGDRVAAEKAAAERRAKEAAELEKKQQPDLTSMGGQAPGDPNEVAKAQLAQLSDSLRTMAEAPGAPKVGVAYALGVKGAQLKDAISTGLSGLRAAAAYMKVKLEGYPHVTEYSNLLGDRHLALSESAHNARKFVEGANKAIPDKLTREAISNWVDAGGDEAKLREALAKTAPEYRAGYERALKLTPDEVTFAKNIQNYFAARLQDAIDAGILEDGIENYIHRYFEKDSPWKQSILNELRSGIFTGRPALAKQRAFEYDFEAEQAGYRPVKDFAKRVAAYDLALNKAIADRQLVKGLMQLKTKEGEPWISVGGVASKVGTDTDSALLVKPDVKPKNLGAYQSFDHPSLRKWKWVAQGEDGQPIIVQGGVLVHPDALPHISTLFERSWFRQKPVGRAMLNAGSTVKSTMLDLSGFHQVQIGLHGFEHRSFAPVKEIDFTNPDVRGLVRGGLVVGETTGRELFDEGLAGTSLSKYLPFGLGERIQQYKQYLFGSYIPRLKVATGLHALERNRAAFPNLSADELNRLTANQMNAAFGELNYAMMGRSQTMQDALRLIMLSPDFTEARARFVGQAATKYGGRPHFQNGKFVIGEQGKALLIGAAALYILARIINKLLSGEYHFEPKNAFNVIHGQKAYSLRTVQGDILHLATDPGQFVRYRLNPLWGRSVIEAVTQKDSFGRTRTIPQQLKDTSEQLIPISLKGLFQGREQSLAESFMNAFGVTEHRESASQNIEQLAEAWKVKHNVFAEPGEFIYDPTKDKYRQLTLAARYGDSDAVKQEIDALVKKGATPEEINKHYALSAQHPFTSSTKANESAFVSSLTADQKKQYQDAVNERNTIAQKVAAANPVATPTRKDFVTQLQQGQSVTNAVIGDWKKGLISTDEYRKLMELAGQQTNRVTLPSGAVANPALDQRVLDFVKLPYPQAKEKYDAATPDEKALWRATFLEKQANFQKQYPFGRATNAAPVLAP